MDLAYEREGSGPTLVLLAGIGMNATAWQPVRSRLAAERELTLIDLPGFGNSAALPGDADSTIDALADAVERCLPELGLERPHVAGNSLGGAIGLELGGAGRSPRSRRSRPQASGPTPRDASRTARCWRLTRSRRGSGRSRRGCWRGRGCAGCCTARCSPTPSG